MTRTLRVVFLLGDCMAGAFTAMTITVGVRLVIAPGSDMVGAMMLGMVIGAVVHLFVSLALSPLLGMFETMIPGMFIGMYGGMLFGMRDSMQLIPVGRALLVDAVFGVAIVLGVRFWDIQLRQRAVSN
jgi:hypothetical protein